MDWDLKITPWNLTESEQEAETNVGSLSSSTTFPGRQANGLGCSVDLKLGGLGDFGSPNKVKDRMRVPTTVVSPSMSSKRARAPSNGVQSASCLVDGCNADLSNCRDYHRRHKVCEAHAKTPMVMVNGQEQRFCQQCSRFHLLAEFDEVKRSCRKRLDGHNRRRRKPQLDPVNTGSLFANRQGSGCSNYSQIFPTPEPNWATVMKTEKNGLYGHNSPLYFVDRQEHFPGSLLEGYGEGKQVPFFQDSDFAFRNRTTEISIFQPFLNTISSPESSTSKLFSSGLTRVFDSDCALSLLSSPAQTSGANLGHSVPAERIPVGQPLVPGLDLCGGLNHYSRSQASSDISPTGFSCSGMEDEHLGTVLVSDVSDSDLHGQGMFHAGADGISDGASQATPFSWQ